MAETNFTPRLGEVFEITASQVNLFRSINAPGYVIGDIAITAAGATYEWDGDSWNSISFGAGGGGAQTPWASNINGGGFDLSSVRDITATRNIRADTIGVIDQEQVGDTGSEWYWKSELAGLSLYSDGSGGVEHWLTIGDPGEGMTLLGPYTIHSAGFEGKEFTSLNTLNGMPFSIQGFSLTGANAQSAIDVSGTWNTSGNPVALKLAISNTASGATSKFLSFLAGAAGATEVFSVDKAGTLTTAGNLLVATNGLYYAASVLNIGTGSIGFGGVSAISGSDVFVTRDAANTLALRNGVNAQTFNVYNTFTDASNYERLAVKFDTNIATIAMLKAGTGAARQLQIGSVNNAGIKLWTDNTISFQTSALATRWNIDPSGHFLAGTDNSFDIGASGATRPRSLFVGTNVQTGSYYTWPGKSLIGSPSDGVITIANVALSDFSRLQFGGTTSSFPSWKRSAAELHSRLADDSADASLQALSFKVATVQVLGAQRTGWSAATGGATRTTFDTSTVTTAQLAERVKALVDDFLVHGAIGA